MAMEQAQLAAWRIHWQDEVDAAWLYRRLTVLVRDDRSRGLCARLAEVEDRHASMWTKVLAEHGVTTPAPAPRLKARMLAWAAERFGPGFLLSMMLREEGREVQGYLVMHRQEAPGEVKDTALTLARDSAQHASALQDLAGTGAAGEPWHQAGSGGFLRNVVYGFNDGLTANFGLVAGVIGGDVSAHVIILSGFSGLLADSLSMGSSGYLAAKSEAEVYEHEIQMERDEIKLMPEVEEQELAILYEAKGMPPDRARQLAHEATADPERFVAESVKEELGISGTRSSPMREAWVTGTATAVGAFIPVVPFLFMTGPAAAWTSFGIAMLSHFAVGAMRSFFTGRGIFRSGIDMFVVGLGVAVLGYVVGDLVAKVL
ncbi:MAG: VIT1/CCC1 transporter family protein [Candidatus Coatesbacteria bacterium]